MHLLYLQDFSAISTTTQILETPCRGVFIDKNRDRPLSVLYAASIETCNYVVMLPLDTMNNVYMNVCMDAHHIKPSIDQPGEVANPSRGPRSRLIIWSRKTGSAIPSRVSLLIPHTQLRMNLIR